MRTHRCSCFRLGLRLQKTSEAGPCCVVDFVRFVCRAEASTFPAPRCCVQPVSHHCWPPAYTDVCKLLRKLEPTRGLAFASLTARVRQLA